MHPLNLELTNSISMPYTHFTSQLSNHIYFIFKFKTRVNRSKYHVTKMPVPVISQE